MNNSYLETLINNALTAASDPIAAAVGFVLLVTYISALRSDRWREWAIGSLLFVSMCAPATDYFENWLRPAPPFDKLVLYGRPITAILLSSSIFALLLLPRPPRRIPLSAAAIALFTLQLLLCARSASAGIYAESLARAITYGAIFYCFVVLLTSLIQSADDLRRVIRYLALALGLYSLATTALMLVGWDRGFEHGRWFGLTGNPNHNGMVIAIYLPAVVGLALCPAETKRWRMIWICIAAFVAIPLALSGSRGGMLSAAVGIMMLFRLKLGRLIFVAIPLFFGFYFASTLLDGGSKTFERLGDFQGETRLYVWQEMISDWLTSPIIGNAGGMRVRENAYLATLQRLGLIGLGVLTLIGLYIFRDAFQTIRKRQNLGTHTILSDVPIAGISAIAANSIVEATFFSNLNQTVFASYIYLVLLGATAKLTLETPVPAAHTPPATA